MGVWQELQFTASAGGTLCSSNGTMLGVQITLSQSEFKYFIVAKTIF